MEKRNKTKPILDFEFDRDSLEQIDQIYQIAAKYIFNVKEEFEREFMRSGTEELGNAIAVWREIADALLLYKKRYVNDEIDVTEGAMFVRGLVGLSMLPVADDIGEALSELDECPRHVLRQLFDCLMDVSGVGAED